ncbi:MAG: chorismate synthase, partial [Alloprevotella tannerae]|nr:chorismate synthase [Alloprevotella tannerae]
MNTFGHLFRLTSFGESHGEAIGGIVDGFPAGIFIDEDFIAGEMARRRPGQSDLTTARQEADRVQLLSGIFEGRSTGCPIGFMIRNEAQRSQDYAEMREAFRPSHADYTYRQKYGLYDYRGGGRASARETAVRVVGGALAKLALHEAGISVEAYTSQIGSIALPYDYRHYDGAAAETNAVRCPDAEKAEEMA